jgi:hypothetical protein
MQVVSAQQEDSAVNCDTLTVYASNSIVHTANVHVRTFSEW